MKKNLMIWVVLLAIAIMGNLNNNLLLTLIGGLPLVYFAYKGILKSKISGKMLIFGILLGVAIFGGATYGLIGQLILLYFSYKGA